MLSFPGRRATVGLFALAGALAGAISWASGQSQNYVVFGAASHVLLRGGDLYALNAPDYFKYSPTFALLFAPFLLLPPWLGATLWGALNAGLVGIGLLRARLSPQNALAALLAIALATDGDQANLLVAGASLCAFAAYERGDDARAAVWIAAASLVKLFPLALVALVLAGPRRARALGALAIALAIGTALPLVVLPTRVLVGEYASWWSLLARDHANEGWSAMNAARAFGVSASPGALQLAGLALQLVPSLFAMRYGADAAWRRTLFASLLCFSVLFNHRAEYTTFTISAVGVMVWLAAERRPAWLVAVAALATIAPGPLFARPEPGTSGVLAFLAAHRLFHPLRVVPLFVLWLAMHVELVSRFVEVRVRLRTEHAR